MLDFKVTKAPLEQQKKIVNAMLTKMQYKASAGKYAVLLSGDPGVGKTSFIRQFAKLMGMEVMIIEGSHVISEHIEQIPFIVYEPLSDTQHTGMIDASDKDGSYHLVFSKSYLIQGLKGLKKIDDSNYIEYIYKQNPHIIKLYEAMGGTKEQAPEDILDARENYKDMLFIDEYFRATDPNIRNALRGILNRQLGDTEIPKGTFIAFASNMNDEGISEISSHQVFTPVEMDNPGKEQWFSWLIDKYLDSDVKLKDEVLNKFYKIIEEEHLSHNDVEQDIRTSPRRWEQILLYVNDSLPIKDLSDANALINNVKAMFTNTDKKYSKLHDGVINAVKELVKDTSGDKISEAEMSDLGKVEHDKWSEQLKHQIERKINLGENRSYVPIISGAPGIGKNAKIMEVANELHLGVVFINAMMYDKISIVGTPITKGAPKKGEEIDFEFHTPKLLHDIESKIAKLDSEIKFPVGAKAKYLIYFDELDKVKDIDVFNALRKVVLEKQFANGEKIPDKSVMVAAINPSGTEGSHKFTGHMADVTDIIHAKPTWRAFISHMKKQELPKKYEKYKDKIADLIEVFGNKFKSEGNDGYWDVEVGGTSLYFSPRDYDNMFTDALGDYDKIVKEVQSQETDDLKAFNSKIKTAMFESFKKGLGAIFYKASMNPNDFFKKLSAWFQGGDTDMLLKDVTMRKPLSKNEVKNVFTKMIEDKKYNPVNGEDNDSQAFIAYMSSVDATEFSTHLREFVDTYIKDGEKQELKLHKPKHNFTTDSGADMPTNEKGLVEELNREFVTSSDNDSQRVLKTYLDVLFTTKGFEKNFKDFVEKYNTDNEDKITTSTNVKTLLDDVYSDVYKVDSKGNKVIDKDTKEAIKTEKYEKQKNPVTPKARSIKNFIETKDKNKYKYLSTLVNDKSLDFVSPPLTTSSTYKNAHKLFHDLEVEKPVEELLTRIDKSIDELDLGGQFKDTVDRELGEELKKLEAEYLLHHVNSFA